ncbi:hypothetical protein HAX54_030229 [Datura stramonium]|uniref:Uncharacterized protein n=1 Tax=Datura stramonium TaxID=4076 RepID=A0ABS8SB00_DATST|nr:hypothetical protein [Datura stramonium]
MKAETLTLVLVNFAGIMLEGRGQSLLPGLYAALLQPCCSPQSGPCHRVWCFSLGCHLLLLLSPPPSHCFVLYLMWLELTMTSMRNCCSSGLFVVNPVQLEDSLEAGWEHVIQRLPNCEIILAQISSASAIPLSAILAGFA